MATKLTKEDEQYLLELGNKKEDLKQLNDAYKECVYWLCKGATKQRRISRTNAIELLGREKFLSGISRSAFHMTAWRDINEESAILFDLTKWW